MKSVITVGVRVDGPWYLRARLWADAIWRFALAAFLVVLAWQAYSLRKLPAWAQVQITREGDNTRAAALSAIADTRKDLLKEVANTRAEVLQQVTALRADVMTRADTLESNADTRIVEISGKLDAQLTRTNDTLASVAGGLQPTLTNTASITAHADGAAAILFRRDALPAQLLGVTAAAKVTLGETAQTMRTIRDATPATVKTWQNIGTNVAGATASVDKLLHPHWWDRVLGYGLNGALLFGQLHPASSVPVQIIQYKSSRP